LALKLIALDQSGVIVPLKGGDMDLVMQSETPLPKFAGIDVKTKPNPSSGGSGSTSS
jgi:hypothetical protein